MSQPIRFDPIRGKYVLELVVAVDFERVDENGQLVMDTAEGIGQGYLTPAQLDAIKNAPPAVHTWHNVDGRSVTLRPEGEGWRCIWLSAQSSNGSATSTVYKVAQADYREFISRLRSQGYVPQKSSDGPHHRAEPKAPRVPPPLTADGVKVPAARPAPQ